MHCSEIEVYKKSALYKGMVEGMIDFVCTEKIVRKILQRRS